MDEVEVGLGVPVELSVMRPALHSIAVPAPFNTIDLATLALKSGEASRVDVELEAGGLDWGGESYPVEPAKVRIRLGHLADRGRTRAAPAARGTPGRPLHAVSHGLGLSGRGRCARGRAAELERRGAHQPLRRGGRPRRRGCGPRRDRPRVAPDAALPARLRGPLPGMRRVAERGRSGHARPRAAARPTLGKLRELQDPEAPRSPLPSSGRMAVPKKRTSAPAATSGVPRTASRPHG